MKKILKYLEVRKIGRVAVDLDIDLLIADSDLLNAGDGDFIAKDVREVFCLYLLTREVLTQGFDMASNAREIFSKVDSMMKNKPGYSQSLVISESLGYNGKRPRWLIAELNMGLNHLTVTNDNPYK